MGHRDAKQLSRNKYRFARLDPDTQSRYDDLDDEPAVLFQSVPIWQLYKQLSWRTGQASLRTNYRLHRQHWSLQRIVYKVLAIGSAKKIENFKLRLMGETTRGDFEIFVRDIAATFNSTELI